jgi:hypothetical protein
MVAAYLPAIFDTDESYLPANVLSIEVSITECSRLNRQNVAGEQVVLNDPPILGPVAADDRVILLVHQLGPSLGFSPLHVSGAFGLDHFPGHAQPDRTVGRTAAACDHVVGVLGGDLVAEEPRRVGAGVGDQRLGLRQLQREFVVQELTEATFDLLSF